MKAMILAAGLGVRLRPFTIEKPKVMVPVGGVPLAQRLLEWLTCYGVTEVGVNLHHLGNEVVNFLGDGRQFGAKVTYSWEDELLGTAGGVKKLEGLFDGTFVVVYGDVLTDIDLNAMVQYHRGKGALVTIAAYTAQNLQECGVLAVDDDGMATAFVEKPTPGSEPGSLANAGIYVVEERVLDRVPPDIYYDFGHDVFPQLIKEREKLYVYRMKPGDRLLDLGTWESYQRSKHIQWDSPFRNGPG